MNIPTINIEGVEYTLATNLRVAFKIQELNAHKAYSKVFEEMAEMPVEKQIEIVYAAFSIANPEMLTTYNKKVFSEYCLDHLNIKDLMDILSDIVKAIMGDDSDDDAATDTEDFEEKN